MPPTAVLLLLLWIACRRACCWAVGWGLPSGVRWHFRHFLGTEMELSISSARMLQQLPHKHIRDRVPRSVLPFSNGAGDAILGSAGVLWDDQRPVLHPFIGKDMAKSWLPALSRELRFPRREGSVDLFDSVMAHISRISSESLGLREHRFPYEVLISEGLWKHGLEYLLPEQLLPSGWSEFWASRYDIASVIRDDTPLFRTLCERYGKAQAVGHLFVLKLGSTLPETGMVCDILLHLAANSEEQQRLFETVRPDGDEAAFESEMRVLAKRFPYFKVVMRWTTEPIDLAGTTIPPGTACAFRLHEANNNGSSSKSFSWGCGIRACPGRALGFRTVCAVVSGILRRYQLSFAPSWSWRLLKSVHTDRIGESYLLRPMLSYQARKAMDA